MDKVLKANKPPNTNVWCDPKNGRWRISHNKGHMRSVSWTHVGEHVALFECLRQLWDWYATEDGLPTPQFVRALLMLDASP